MTRPSHGTDDGVKPRVLFVTGAAHSGSTILSLALGSIEGFCAVGEMAGLWRGRHATCACGRAFESCPVWSPVLRHVLGTTAARQEALARLSRTEDRDVRMRRMMSLLGRGTPAPDVASYVATVSALYRGLARQTGAQVIVDSTKSPAIAAALTAASDIDVAYLHLVRDPRAVAYSWLRRAATGPSDPRYPNYPPGAAAMSWLTINAAAALLSTRGAQLRVRYEDFVRRPGATLRTIAHHAGVADVTLPLEGATLHLTSAHTVAGNRGVLGQQGRVQLREDSEWVTGLTPLQRARVGALTLPLRVRYGYLGSSSAVSAR